jgi:hypothetical protein
LEFDDVHCDGVKSESGMVVKEEWVGNRLVEFEQNCSLVISMAKGWVTGM